MRVAVLGQGSIGRRHVGILSDLGCRIVAFDPAVEGSAKSEEAALDGVDAAVVASPSHEHERQAALALAVGVPVLVEKPAAIDAAGAERLEHQAAKSGVAFDVAMNLRHHPGVLAMRELLPRVGRVVRAAAWCGSWRPRTEHRRSDRRALGGGILLDALDEIDYMLWLLGPARGAAGTRAHASSLDADIEDVAHVLIDHESSAHSMIGLDYVDREYHRGCRIVGEEGTIDWDWARGTVRVGSEEHLAPSDAASTYVSQMKRFLAVARGEREPLVSAAAARAALDVVDAVRGVQLRPAGFGDSDQLLAWRNEPATRTASRNTGEVAPEEHAAWLARRLGNPETRIFVVELCGEPAGTVRLDRLAGDRGEIHVSLAPQARGRGLATSVLRAAARRGAAELELATVVANVREDNAPSLRAFSRAGFECAGRDGEWISLTWQRA